MPNSTADLVPFHNISSIEAIEITKTSLESGWTNLYASIVRVQPFSSSFSSVDSLLISMVLKGQSRARWEVDGELSEIVLEPGAIIILPPGAPIEVNIKDPVEFINIYISKNLFNDVIIEFSSYTSSILRLDNFIFLFDDFIENIIKSLIDILYVGGRFSCMEAQYIVRVLVARVVSKYSESTSKDLNMDAGLSVPVLQRTFNFIDENLHRRIVIERLAETAGVGAAQFARLFKRATNVTLHQYIIKRRVERARHLLMETHMSIAEIAHECGFADQVHLTRFFGRIIGTSPASFRKKERRI
ncbi:AraC family transcriptional regulator [Ochrobactrum sp. Marseille-Q0166]|uniref:helix-turn-helix domain-containing protein n=1 Tax=Ochrobactrum sp. Marseille-Q0166 TaxID=2761105 RepID=UPI0016552648|nr:AraC family transcriptional regulator [Ochrobactrum sp. Marseille-Q0166]MBC8716937.1 helix-turn-helix transcriptional regulator [Ochrobactrum sp. Marseille-Q0166]